VACGARGIDRRPSPGTAAPFAERLRGAGTVLPPLHIEPAGAAESPLSPVQERMWFLEKLQPGSPVQLYAVGFEIRGPLDLGALERALAAIVQRHEIHRTSIREREGIPELHVAPTATYPLLTFDLRSSPESGRREHALDLCRDEARRPYELVTPPLARVVLVRIADEAYVIAFCRHHLIADGRSTGILFSELAELYAAALTGVDLHSVLPPLPIQYTDYARWTHDAALGDAYAGQLAYWRAQLAEAPAMLGLALDKPRRAVQRFAWSYVERTFEDRRGLREVARAADATLFQTLLAAIHVLLYRSSDRSDISVGFPVAGRPLAELEPLIGCFVNTVVLRTAPDPAETFAQFLERVRDTARTAYANQDVPFDRIIEALHPERNLSYSPLIQAMATLLDARRPSLELAGIAVEPVELGFFGAPSDVFFEFLESADGLRCRLQYDTDLFERASADAMLDALVVLLGEISRDPTREIAVIPLIGEDEARLTVALARATLRNDDALVPLHVSFAERAAQNPAAIAIVDGEATLTYGELATHANRVARRLADLGVASGDLVGILSERSAAAIVAMLGVLQLGAAYVPLDVSNPAERIAAIAAESGICVLLCATADVSRLHDTGIPVASLASLAAIDPAIDADGEVLAPSDVDTLANVIYTSGSTGQPKGVMVTHRGIARLFADSQELDVRPDDIVAHLCNLAFDVASFEIWGALTRGARLVIVRVDQLLSPREFAATVLREGITLVAMPTALFHEYAAHHADMFGSLRMLVVAGESLHPDAAGAVLAAGAPERFINAYGPTEATVFATAFRICAVAPGQRSVPIGTPVANTSVYVLDRADAIVPPGVAGEICIGGPGVARGYLCQPDRTRERFVDDPFGPAGATMYRTGDRARYRNDGSIDFLGRIDRQIKVRGYRMELDEIEAVLRRHEAVREAVVSVVGETLVAFVVLCDPADVVEAREIERFARRWLPLYMVPACTLVTVLPLTANGKIDRSALLRVEPPVRNDDLAEGSRTETQSLLIAILRDLLHKHTIALQDDFFDLGGHSLLAIRFATEFERRSGRRFPVSALFTHSTVESLAAYIDDAGKRTATNLAVTTLNPAGARPPFFFFHGDVAGQGLYTRPLAAHLGREQPIFVVAVHGTADLPLFDSIEAMAADSLTHIRNAQPAGPYRLAGFCSGGLVAYEAARMLAAQGEAIERLVLINASALPTRSFDFIDAAVRAIALDMRLPARLRMRLSQALAWINAGLVAGPVSFVRFLRERLPTLLRPREVTWESVPGQAGPNQTVTAEDTAFAHVIAASFSYHPRGFDGPLTLIWGDRQNTRIEVAERGWRAVAANLDLLATDGGHADLLSANLKSLSVALARALGAPYARSHVLATSSVAEVDYAAGTAERQ
jgi:amino acid adenylation domain-containing protein